MIEIILDSIKQSAALEKHEMFPSQQCSSIGWAWNVFRSLLSAFGSDLAMLLENCHQPEPNDQFKMNLVGLYMTASKECNIISFIHIESMKQCSTIGWAWNVFINMLLRLLDMLLENCHQPEQ
jgi:hypothetical protein